MYSLVDLGLLAFIALAIVGVFFLYEKVLALRAFSFLKYNDYVLDASGGIIFGLSTIVLNLIAKAISPSFNIPMFYIVAVVLIVVKAPATSLMSIFIPMVYYIIDIESIYLSLVNISSLGIILTVYIIADFFSTKNSSYVLFISLIVTSVITLFIIHDGGNIEYGRLLYENSIFIPLAILIVYYPLRVAIRFSISASILFESVNFVHGGYYRHSLFPTIFGEYLASNTVNKGYLILFEIDTEGSNKYEDISEVRQTILSKIENYYDEESLYFQYSERIYGVFVQTDSIDHISLMIEENNSSRTEGFLKDVEVLFKNLSKTYLTSSNEILSVNIKGGSSLYGVQTSSLDELQRNALFAINNLSKGIVNLYDSRMMINRNKDLLMVNELDKSLDLNTFDVNIIKLENSTEKWGYVDVVKNDENVNIESVRELKKITNWSRTFDRYFAAAAIDKNKGKKLIINYSPLEFKDFQYKPLLENIIKSGTSINDLIFVVEDISKIDQDKLIELGIRYGKMYYDQNDKPIKIEEVSAKENTNTFSFIEKYEQTNNNDDKEFFIQN